MILKQHIARLPILLCCLFFCLGPALSEEIGDDAIVTDRPDIAESALTVGTGRFQIETGVTYTQETGAANALTTPTLLRYGIAEKWELRLESDALTFLDPGPGGFSDFTLGTKVNFRDEGSTAIGLLVSLNVPVGFQAVRGTVDPAVKLLIDQDLGSGWGLGFNAGLLLTEDVTDRSFIQPMFAAALGKDITNRLGAYVELSGEGPDLAGGDYALSADGGFTYLVNNDVQLDLSLLRGLSNVGTDWGYGLGVSARF